MICRNMFLSDSFLVGVVNWFLSYEVRFRVTILCKNNHLVLLRGLGLFEIFDIEYLKLISISHMSRVLIIRDLIVEIL